MHTENSITYRPGKFPYYEVWYWKWNDDRAGLALWVRMTLLVSKLYPKGIAENWGICFRRDRNSWEKVAVKEKYELSSLSVGSGFIGLGACSWGEERTQGRIRSHSQEISWDLKKESFEFSFNPAPRIFQKLGLLKSHSITVHPNLKFSGQCQVHGRTYKVSQAEGMQGHLFGSKNAESWAWGHCNLFLQGNPFIFEAITAKVRAGNFTLPYLSAFFFVWNQKRYEFNTLSSAFFAHSSFSLEGWHFKVGSKDLMFEGKVFSEPADFVGVKYEDTRARDLYCHNTKIASMEVRVFQNHRCVDFYQSYETTAFEIVREELDSRVQRVL